MKFREKFDSLYKFISGSSNRTFKLQQIQELLGEPQLTVKEPHAIRWLGLKNAVKAVYDCYNSILATLSTFAAEKQPAASGLLKYFSQYKTILLVAFMLDVHDVVGILRKELQKQNIVFSEIKPLMEATFAKLDYLEKNDGGAMKTMRDDIEIKSEKEGKHAYLQGEKLQNYSEKVEQDFSSLRSRYISKLKTNIQSRFRKEDSDIFEDLSLLFEPMVVNDAGENESEDALDALGQFYGENKTVKVVHGSLQTELQEEVTNVTRLVDKDKLKQEWPMLKGMISGSYKRLSTPALCRRVIQMHQESMPELSKLCQIALCVSVTSVECERSFSTKIALNANTGARLNQKF